MEGEGGGKDAAKHLDVEEVAREGGIFCNGIFKRDLGIV